MYPVFQVTRVEEGHGPNKGAVHVFGLTKVRSASIARDMIVIAFDEQEGATVLATVYDHVQSFYIECPKDFTDKELKPFLKHMNVSILLRPARHYHLTQRISLGRLPRHFSHQSRPRSHGSCRSWP